MTPGIGLESYIESSLKGKEEDGEEMEEEKQEETKEEEDHIDESIIKAAEGEGLSKIYSHKGAAIILDGVSNARISGFEIASENDQALVVRNSSAEITNNILISAKESSAAYFENNSGKIFCSSE
jgi:hypothetical protein